MLDKHLIAKTNPIANPENIVLWRDYRITVLQDRLFRLEKSASHKFRDDATQCVFFRNMPKQEFTAVEKEGSLILTTSACTLILKKARRDCRILLGGKEIKITNAGNLMGTCRTLDCCDGEYFVGYRLNERKRLHLGTGVCSRLGVAVVDDSASLTLGSDGEVKGIRGVGSDEYIFAYGHNYIEAVRALYLITGRPPMIPRYALGNWWSRYHAYTDREYLRLLNKFEENKIPLSVATVDMDWHYSDNMVEELHLTLTDEEEEKRRNGYRFGWTGYTWNQNLFSDYRAFLKNVSDRGLKITLNLHPSEGIGRWEGCYREMAEAMGISADTEITIPFDIANGNFINNYFKVLHKPYERDGVEFWWIDWQQGETSGLKGLDPLWSLNHYHYLDAAENHEIPLILSRYSGVGSHRYPVGFSGDTVISWKTLSYLPRFTATASNIGYCWWSHDIGGHMHGCTDGELYVRFLQYGVFSPINRLHSSDNETVTKEPWVYENGRGEIAADFLRLRHRLIPYLYSAANRLHEDGIPLIQPLYYRYPEKEEAYFYQNEYFFGSELLVAPVVSPLKADGYSRTKAWIPQGRWTDIFTGDCYEAPEGGAECVLYRTLDSIPVLAKQGAILPYAGEGKSTDLRVDFYSGNGEFRLVDENYSILFSVRETSEGSLATIQTSGFAQRKLRLRFADVVEGKVKVFVGEKEVEYFDRSTDDLAVEFIIEEDGAYSVELFCSRKSCLERLIERSRRILIQAEDDNDLKWNVWKAICNIKTEKEFISAVEKSGLKTITILRLKETTFN